MKYLSGVLVSGRGEAGGTAGFRASQVHRGARHTGEEGHRHQGRRRSEVGRAHRKCTISTATTNTATTTTTTTTTSIYN